MFTIDLMLDRFPLPVSVQRKTEEDANALYQDIRAAMESGEPKLLELTCDRDTGKKISVMSSHIRGVQMSQKDGASTTGNAPGFFAALADSQR